MRGPFLLLAVLCVWQVSAQETPRLQVPTFHDGSVFQIAISFDSPKPVFAYESLPLTVTNGNGTFSENQFFGSGATSTVFLVDITPTQPFQTITLYIAADGNSADDVHKTVPYIQGATGGATQLDIEAPSVHNGITSPFGVHPVDVYFTFANPVSVIDFTFDDIVLVNATVYTGGSRRLEAIDPSAVPEEAVVVGVGGSRAEDGGHGRDLQGASYTGFLLTIEPQADGDIIVFVAKDVVQEPGNTEALAVITYVAADDGTPAETTILAPSSHSGSPIDIIVEFSRPVLGFTEDYAKVLVANEARPPIAGSFRPSPANSTTRYTMQFSGYEFYSMYLEVTPWRFPANASTPQASPASRTVRYANSFWVTPIVLAPPVHDLDPFVALVVFSDWPYIGWPGLSLGDVIITDGVATASNLVSYPSNSSYSVTITPHTAEDVTFQVRDDDGFPFYDFNPSLYSTVHYVPANASFDNVTTYIEAPLIHDGSSPFLVLFSFSGPVKGFDVADVSLTGGTFSSAFFDKISDLEFAITVTPQPTDTFIRVNADVVGHPPNLPAEWQVLYVPPSQTPSPTPSPSMTISGTPSNTATISVTPSNTATISVTPSITPSPSATPSSSETVSGSASTTPSWSTTPTVTPTPSETVSGTATTTPTISNTPSFTPSASPSPSASETVSGTPSASETVSNSPSASETVSGTPSITPTPSETVSGTASTTPTISITPSITPTVSVTPSTTPTISNTPSATPSASPSPSASETVSNSPTASETVSTSASPTPTISNSPSSSETVSTSASPTPTISNSPSFTASPSSSPSNTPTVSVTPSITPTVSNSPSITPTISNSPSSTPSNSPSASGTPSASLTVSTTPSWSPSPSATPSVSTSTSQTPSISTSISQTPSNSRTPSQTPSNSHTPSQTPSNSQTPSATPSYGHSPTPSPSRPPSSSPSPTPSPSSSPSSTPSFSTTASQTPSFSPTASRTSSVSTSATPTPSASTTPVGATVSPRPLPSDRCATVTCSGHGACNEGVCSCEDGWTTFDCSEEVPSDIPAHCFDGATNSGESDVDCGGPCAACQDGFTCDLQADCLDTATCTVLNVCTPDAIVRDGTYLNLVLSFEDTPKSSFADGEVTALLREIIAEISTNVTLSGEVYTVADVVIVDVRDLSTPAAPLRALQTVGTAVEVNVLLRLEADGPRIETAVREWVESDGLYVTLVEDLPGVDLREIDLTEADTEDSSDTPLQPVTPGGPFEPDDGGGFPVIPVVVAVVAVVALVGAGLFVLWRRKRGGVAEKPKPVTGVEMKPVAPNAIDAFLAEQKKQPGEAKNTPDTRDLLHPNRTGRRAVFGPTAARGVREDEVVSENPLVAATEGEQAPAVVETENPLASDDVRLSIDENTARRASTEDAAPPIETQPTDMPDRSSRRDMMAAGAPQPTTPTTPGRRRSAFGTLEARSAVSMLPQEGEEGGTVPGAVAEQPSGWDAISDDDGAADEDVEEWDGTTKRRGRPRLPFMRTRD